MILSLLMTLMAPHESWLVGGWAPRESACGSESGIRFETDGTYSELESEGVWSLAGHRLTIQSTDSDNFGQSDIVEVTALGALEMDLQWPDGTRAKLHRCPQES